MSITALKKIEEGSSALSTDQVDELRRALDAAGVEFTNGDEPGVKLKGTARKAR
jgi:hypothetical protein